MPPIYKWVNENQEEVEVVRTFSDIDEKPTKEEFENADEYKWERVLSSGITKVRGDNWSGRKGSW